MTDLTWVLAIRNETLTSFFEVFPWFASEPFYLILLAVGYWVWDRKAFKDFSILICLSSLLNCWLKYHYRMPRPTIEHLVAVKDPFSFPSGDAQIVATITFAIAWRYKHPALWVFAFLFTFLVCFSRVYLGAHYPIDVIAGAIIGVSLVAVYYAVKNSELWQHIQEHDRLLFIAFAALIAGYICDMNTDLNFISVSSAGALLGIGIGSLLYTRFCNDLLDYSWQMRIGTAMLGLLSTYAIRSGLFKLLPGESNLAYLFIVFSILSTYIFFVVPWLIERIRRFI